MCGPPPDKVGPSYDQTVQADINQQMWDYDQTNYVPIRNKYIQSRTDPKTTETEKKAVAGKVNADVMKNVKPASATNAVKNAKNMMNASDVEASAQQLGRTSEKAHEIGTDQNLIAMGKGQNTKVLSGMGEMANMSVNAAIQDKQREEQVEATTENAIGSGIGTVAAAGAYGARKMKGDPDYENFLNSGGGVGLTRKQMQDF